MRISSRRKAIAFFLSFGVILAAIAFAVGSGWIILNWQEGVKVFLGIVFFGAIVTGFVLNTIFLVREIRRNEQHDSFINAVTHELKTPIASIRLYLETLQRREVDEARRREFYQLMLVDTERLMSTVEQVLKAGALAQKKAKAQRVPVDMSAVVSECVDLARARHHLSEENLLYQGAASTLVDGHAQVLGDPEDLHTAVTNLLDNAVKYSPDGIHINVELAASGDERIVLRVRDRGVGIPQNELKRIFKRFYRVRQRGRARVKGTGLGLFIVRAIARNHGGRVFAESEGAGKGTTVTLDLPRLPDEVSAKSSAAASEETHRPESHHAGSRTA
ncbi:MAG TPA: HAMP domain-containing sensor histidine kinase [Terriglobales bacterium]|nr:HAMP domain-containing sensor histidine kinase [Terriglobales bacterium]